MVDPFENGDPSLTLDEYDIVDGDRPSIGQRVPDLYNPKPHADPNDILRERPEHRMVLHLKMAGNSNQEIAEIMGYSYGHVAKITRQKWFLKAFATIAAENGKDALDELFKSEGLNSVHTLIEIRDDPNAKHADRRLSAEHLLDRFLGKPTQKSESNVNYYKSPTELGDAASETEAEIKKLEKELSLGGTN